MESVAMRDVRLNIDCEMFVVAVVFGRAKRGEARMAVVGKPWDVRTRERLVEVGREVKGEPSSRMIPVRRVMFRGGAVGPRRRERVGRKKVSITGYLGVFCQMCGFVWFVR